MFDRDSILITERFDMLEKSLGFYRQQRIALNQWRLARTPIFRRFHPVIPLRMVDSRCAVSKKNRFVYFRIPKAANSTVVLTLQYANTEEKTKSPTHINEIKKSYSKPSSLSQSEVQEMICSYWKFTVVRNPYDRLLSAYLSKIARNKAPKKTVAAFLGRSVEAHITIDEFLDYLEYGGGIKEDAHWALQTDLIFIPLEKIDFVGRVENLDEDLRFITKKIFGHETATKDYRPHRTEL